MVTFTSQEVYAVAGLPLNSVDLGTIANNAGDTISINWDGTHTSTATIDPNTGEIEGSFNGQPASTIQLTISDPNGNVIGTEIDTANVASFAPQAVNAFAGVPLVNVDLGTLSNADPGDTISINWDGTHTSAATILANGEVEGSFSGQPASTIQLTIFDPNGNIIGTESDSANVTTFTPQEVYTVAGVPLNSVDLGTIVNNVGDTISINWNGSDTTSASILADGEIEGSFSGQPASTIQLTISDPHGNIIANVNDPVNIATFTPQEVYVVSGSPSSNVDLGTLANAAGYTISIDWGDGSPASGANISGSGEVEGSHLYVGPPFLPIELTISDPNGNVIGTESDTVNFATFTPQAINAVAGVPLVNVDLGTLSNADPGDTISINWDGTHTSAATILANGEVEGSFSGQPASNIQLTIFDPNGNIIGTEMDSFNAISSLTITLAPQVEGNQFSGQSVATFNDSYNGDDSADLTAVITWNDNSTSAATIADNAGVYTVTMVGPHTFAEEGTLAISVAIYADNNLTTPIDTISGNVTVNDALLVNEPVSAVNGTEGQTLNNVIVADFKDTNPNGTSGDYSAVITWPDNSTSAGTIQSDGHGGFDVLGNGFTPAEYGNYSISVAIKDIDGNNPARRCY